MENVYDSMCDLVKKYNLLDLDLVDENKLRQETDDFLKTAVWPSSSENEDVIFDTIYDLGYELMNIWFKPIAARVCRGELDCEDEYDLKIQKLLHDYFSNIVTFSNMSPSFHS